MSPLYDGHDSSIWTAVAIRAPDAAWNGSRYLGSELDSVNETGALALGLTYRLVRDGHFCAVAASSREAALQVLAALQLRWRPAVVAVSTGAAATPRPYTFERQYGWRVSASSTAGDRSALPGRGGYLDAPCKAFWNGDALTLWASTGRDAELTAEAAAIFDLPRMQVSVVSAETTPDQASYDAVIDAAIVARVVRRPVQVWPACKVDADALLTIGQAADLGTDGSLQAWTTQPGQPDVLRPSAAWVCTLAGKEAVRFPSRWAADSPQLPTGYVKQAVAATPRATMRLSGGVDADTQRAASLFAQESFVDELAQVAGVDPVQWRLRQLQDPAGRALVEQVAAVARWQVRVRGQGGQDGQESSGAARRRTGVRRGQGFAFAQVVDESSDPPQRAWAAWVVDVSVDASSGQVSLDKITVGHHLDELIIADASDARWGQKIRRTAQALLQSGGSHDQWATRPTQAATPMTQRTGLVREPANSTPSQARPAALSASTALGLPAAAAVANAIYDATGVRLREAPFGMNLNDVPLRLGQPDEPIAFSRLASTKTASRRKPRRAWIWPLGVVGSLAGGVMMAIPWRPAISPVTPDLTVYSVAAIERGRLIAAASDCVVCHTAPDGARNAGGLAMDTPFGTIFTTNITPDRDTGIGAWSFAAFDRAMRQGISRDGQHLYPAFPYTSFAKFSDGDMQALYAFLMSEPAVESTPPMTRLAFPYNARSMMAYWNLLFHKNETYVYDSDQSRVWNRGAYLVQGPGHCMACHSPRNALGAEKNGPRDFLAGGVVDGWDAPALNGTAPTTAAWTTQDTFQYLRTGFSERHGVAAGPMAPVVASLQALPDSDIQAMAVYLNSLSTKTKSQSAQEVSPPPDSPFPGLQPVAHTSAAPPSGSPELRVLSLAGQNIYEGACAACHDATRGSPQFGVRPSLPLNTNITADKPDNLIRIVLEGISQPADSALGYMPGFAGNLNDVQIAELASYLRGNYAAQRAPWQNLESSVRRVREEVDRHARGASHTSDAQPTGAALPTAGARR